MRKKRVLLVEDQANVALLMAESLAGLDPDLEVVTAASGEEALQRMEQKVWDLVVTDYRMPGITGLQLIETSKLKTPTTLWVLMTAYGSEEVRQAAERLDVYHYMTKPFPLADLRRVIQEALAFQERGTAPGASAAATKTFRPAIKVTLGGDGSVGKTALIRRLITGQFDATRKMTIGVDFHLYEVHNAVSTRLIVWDVSGQDHFAFTRKAFYRGSKAIGLVYAVSERRSFERVVTWRDEIRQILPSVPLVLVGNKTDLPRQVTYAEGKAIADAWSAPFLETSCVDGSGVREFFTTLTEAAVQYARERNPAQPFDVLSAQA